MFKRDWPSIVKEITASGNWSVPVWASVYLPLL
jgi:hypothetical protein